MSCNCVYGLNYKVVWPDVLFSVFPVHVYPSWLLADGPPMEPPFCKITVERSSAIGNLWSWNTHGLISVPNFTRTLLDPQLGNAETIATSAQTSASPVAMTAPTQPPQRVWGWLGSRSGCWPRPWVYLLTMFGPLGLPDKPIRGCCSDEWDLETPPLAVTCNF